MKNPMKEHIGQQVDAKSEELWQEFLKHEQECRAKNPNMTDRSVIMQLWMMQKIAGLQSLTLNLVQRVCELESHSGKR